jgi:hypothetical protein
LSQSQKDNSNESDVISQIQALLSAEGLQLLCEYLLKPLRLLTYLGSQDVAQATIYVSAKMHDTIKKPQDILDVGYTVRYPHLVNVTGVADIDAEVCTSVLPTRLHNNLTKPIAQSR